MNTTPVTFTAFGRAALGGTVLPGMLKMALRLLSALVVRRSMAKLHQLDDHVLKDIGLHRSEIESAVRQRHGRPPWRT